MENASINDTGRWFDFLLYAIGFLKAIFASRICFHIFLFNVIQVSNILSDFLDFLHFFTNRGLAYIDTKESDYINSSILYSP